MNAATIVAVLAMPMMMTPRVVSSVVPVPVIRCSLSASKAGSVMWISFVNRSSVIADDVHVNVTLSSHDVRGIVDRGTFSPSVVIEHAFRLPSDGAPNDDRAISCRVPYAHFVDGNEWTP
jgi:hypothetical protein